MSPPSDCSGTVIRYWFYAALAGGDAVHAPRTAANGTMVSAIVATIVADCS